MELERSRPWTCEGSRRKRLEEEEVPCGDEGETRCSSARVQKEDAALRLVRPRAHRRLVRRLIVALAYGHMRDARVRQDEIDVLDGISVL